jgi:hypothetical protein
MHTLGSPRPGEVLLFLGGAAVGFLALAIVAFGQVVVELETPESKRVSLFGTMHVLSAGSAVLATWGATAAIDGTAGWPVAGWLATVLYLLVSAMQVTAASPEDG